MQNQQMINTAPDWTTTEKDLHCPLCEYNLRGLTGSRCPECGFKFQWQELIEAEKNNHSFLFEYGRRRNIKTFWKTYWRTCRPRRFWKEVNPAQEVKKSRLLVYWILSSCVIGALVAAEYAAPAWRVGYRTYTLRAAAVPAVGSPGYYVNGPATTGPPFVSFGWPSAQFLLDEEYPPPWRAKFWKEVEQTKTQSGYVSFVGVPHVIENPTFGLGVIFLAWPLSTLFALLVFRWSMRQARIKTSHIVRTIIYSCDFGPLLVICIAAGGWVFESLNQGCYLFMFATFCALVTGYRLTIAFRQYLRVHLPFATVLASQLIVLLIIFLIVIQLADFSRQI